MADLGPPDPAALDRSGMLGHIRSVGPEFLRAWQRSEELRLPEGAGQAAMVVVAGMGGSATAADYFAAVCAPVAQVPVTVVRGYRLPNFVSESTLVVILSYSGGTDEALACYDDAWKRGAMLTVVTRGGALGARAAADGIAVHPVEYASPPRAATVHSLAPLLRLGGRLGLCAVVAADIEEAARAHQDLVEAALAPGLPARKNRAKQVAGSLVGRVPFVLGAEHLAVAATRMRNQLAENGKALAADGSLPEAGHNLVVGLETARKAAPNAAAVTLESPALYDARVQRGFAAVAELFADAGLPVFRIEVDGPTILAQLLQATAWGDFVSYYLALANGVDPTPIPQIDRLKAALPEAIG